jgi:hypothetical protein
VHREVFFLLEELHEQPLAAAVRVPVHEAEVVAGGVVPVVRELDPAAGLLASALAPPRAAHRAPRDEREGLEPLLEGLVEELRAAFHGRFRSAAQPAQH